MKKAIIYIYDLIYPELVSASYIREQVEEAEAQGFDKFELHINSGGGSVWEGIAIYNYLKNKDVVVYVDGLAASIASIIAMAGKEIIMYSSSMMMIHNPWLFDEGEARELRKSADMLDQVKSSIVEAYKERTGLTKDELFEMMDETTWLTAKEAVKKGFASSVEKIKPASKNFVGAFVNLIDDNSNKNKGKKMNKEFLAFLGLPEDATEEQVINKITELKKEFGLDEKATIVDVIDAIRASEENNPIKEDDPGKEEEDNDPVNDVKKTIAEFELKQLKREAEAVVDKAVEDKKILPVDRDVWLKNAIDDLEGTKEKLGKKKINDAIPGKVHVNKDGKIERKKGREAIDEAVEYFKANR